MYSERAEGKRARNAYYGDSPDSVLTHYQTHPIQTIQSRSDEITASLINAKTKL